MQKLIICIVGMAGSGKSTVADFIEKKFNAKIVHSGDIIREEIKNRGLKYSPKADMAIAHWFHEQGREKLVVERTLDRVKSSKKKLIVLEGMRNNAQVGYIKELADSPVVVIAVIASAKVRYKRELLRQRFGAKESLAYLKKRDKSEASHGLKKLIASANYKINNSKLTEHETNAKAAELIKSVLAQYQTS